LMRSSREDEAQAILEANPRVARRWAERQKALGH
jgi:hypothetical protein